ncbi:uncharacterized protein LOC129918001, partial [Episyrphus balteatus]|uniref:uncharacterized protein LOC129918001 n=1 Tax=Episyrphus balteatus TaxID=286459 RepID=UPI0024867D36
HRTTSSTRQERTPPRRSRDVAKAKDGTRDRNTPSSKSASEKCQKKPSRSQKAKDRVLPKRGEPGGLDDPFRKGLSGAATRRYLDLLAEGKTPEEAKRRVEERRAELLAESLKSQGQGKRKNHHITPPQRQEVKKPRLGNSAEAGSNTALNTSKRPLSYANTTKSVRIAILPKEYPDATLGTDELTALEEAIIEEVSLGWKHKLQFNGIHFKTGLLVVDCAGQQTADWLKEKAARLSTWKGTALVACLGENIPKLHTITMFLPRSKDQEDQKSLALIEAQNDGLCVKAWKIIKSKAEGKGKLLVAKIDTNSAKTITNAGHELHFKFGKIPITGLRKNNVEANTHHQGNDPTTSDSTDQPPTTNQTPKAPHPINPIPLPPPPPPPPPSIPVVQVNQVAEMEKGSVNGEDEGMDLSPLRVSPDEALPTEEEEEHLLADEGAFAPIL